MRIVLLVLAGLLLIPIAVIGKVSPVLMEHPGERAKAVVVLEDDTRPGGLAFARTAITTAEAQKVAEQPGVIAVLPNTPIEVPPVPAPHLGWEDLRPAHRDFQSGIQPEMWFARDVHRAPTAWASGYTGTG
jgi:hypothetical protein